MSLTNKTKSTTAEQFVQVLNEVRIVREFVGRIWVKYSPRNLQWHRFAMDYGMAYPRVLCHWYIIGIWSPLRTLWMTASIKQNASKLTFGPLSNKWISPLETQFIVNFSGKIGMDMDPYWMPQFSCKMHFCHLFIWTGRIEVLFADMKFTLIFIQNFLPEILKNDATFFPLLMQALIAIRFSFRQIVLQHFCTVY